MSAEQFATFLLGLGVGGAIGALAALFLAAIRLTESAEVFAGQFRAYVSTRTDPDTARLREAFEAFEGRLATLLEAARRARRALGRGS